MVLTELGVALGLLFLASCFVFVLFHSQSAGRVTLLDWTLLGIGGFYGGGWSLVVFVANAGGNPLWYRWIAPNQSLYPLHTMVAAILAASIIVGWWMFRWLGDRPAITNHDQIRTITDRRLTVVFWGLLVLSVVAQWIYVQAYGGFVGLLSYTVYIRSGIIPVENSWSFLWRFGGFSLFASFGFFGLILSGRRAFSVWIGLLVSFLFSIYILYSWLGRINFLVYMSTFILGFLIWMRLNASRIIIAGMAVMALILLFSYYISVLFDWKSSNNLLNFLAKELSYPFASFFGQITAGNGGIRWFIDFLIAPVFLLPRNIWSDWLTSVSEVNTTLIMGAPKGTWGVTGSIPTDLLTLGYLEASVFGVVVLGVSFGALLRLLQYLLSKLSNVGVMSVFEAYAALKIAVLAVFYAQPELFIPSNLTFMISLLVIVIAGFGKRADNRSSAEAW